LRVPKDTSGTRVPGRLIARLIREGAKDFYIRQKAIKIIRAARVRPEVNCAEYPLYGK
jgi:hypothetical protein